MKRTPKIFCAGIGYTALELIKALAQTDQGWQFAGSIKNLNKLEALQDRNIQVTEFTGLQTMANLTALKEATHLLISIPPADAHAEPFLHFHQEALTNLKNLEWVGYLSTTGVYGDQDGKWVDEETPLPPENQLSKRGYARMMAENQWQKIAADHNIPVHIFRLSSIYGEGRGAFNSLMSGRAKKIIKEGQFFSRIHVEDIAQILMASMIKGGNGRIYNIADDVPFAPDQITDYLCKEMHIPLLEGISVNDPSLSPLMKSFYSENKRITNKRIKQELGITLKYPSFKEGYAPQILKYKKDHS